jgi:hypothetical protein
MIFVAQVEDGNAVIRKAEPRINLTDMVWSHVTTINNVSELSIMFDGYGMFNGIIFGSGTVEPSPTDTALTTRLGTKAATLVNFDYSRVRPEGVSAVKKTCRLQDTEFVGSTIAEVGITDSSSSAVAYTKALLRDANGNVITITKGVGQILDIYATLYFKFKGDFSEYWDITKGCAPLYTSGNGFFAGKTWALPGRKHVHGGHEYMPNASEIGNFSVTKDANNRKVTFNIPIAEQ